jgi:hypothetical protein
MSKKHGEKQSFRFEVSRKCLHSLWRDQRTGTPELAEVEEKVRRREIVLQ